ncbi:hypothetical protein BDW74DRAFT_167617 [Aspergillus multicolor]|uniref:mRNA-binding translational repressor SSD1 n=1 Tax=Aspergillus multicolor TaxID=41759 RepID=UPI003CCC9B01
MDQQNQSGVPGPAGRKLHIAHRRSPSELTPLMMEQLAIQQQIELLQQQQQQIAATHQQYVSMGLLQPQQIGQASGFTPSLQGGGAGLGGVSQQQLGAFQFPQVAQQQQLGIPGNASNQHSHRRNQSALPGFGMGGPPPAPSSGASGYSDYNQQQQGNFQKNDNGGPGRGRGGPPGGGHQRRHSLALPEAKKAAELAQQKRAASGFQFPAPSGDSSEGPSTSDDKPTTPNTAQSAQGLGLHRAGNIRASAHGRSQSMAVGGNRGSLSGRGPGGFQFPANDGSAGPENQRRGSQASHARTPSRNFDGNWRQPNNQAQAQDQSKGLGQQNSGFQPGHRARASMNQSIGSIGSFQYPGQPQLIQLPQGQVVMAPPQMFGGAQQLNPLQLAQLQALQQGGQLNGQGLGGLQASQHAPQPLSAQQTQQQQQQQRKTLFTPYLPQANLPALLSNGQLVSGILRVNKKNRSDAYVTTPDLDADIFICGSKDRNRALEGDFVAIELLDVDEVWSQKREKEEKKKRKDITDARSGSNAGTDKMSRSDSTGDRQEIGPDGSIRRRGSLRQRPTQKKNDDVEVEGQSLLLVEEDEISDEQKPLYAGHVVAVIERIAGQMFSGTLGLLRPSSQATKEKQEAERLARDGAHGRQQDRQQDKPKIVWFKPTDKRVPLIAIPTEQAPRDFVEKHQDYANRIFVACIKRWPITSLHPFGTLVEQLGEMGDLKVETEALLRDNNFGSDEFTDAVLKSIGWENWSVASEADLSSRRDFRQETTFTVEPSGTNELDNAYHFKTLPDEKVEIGIHVTDIAHFVKANSLVDREAKKRGTAVYLVDRLVKLLPPRIATELCALLPGEERLTVSVVFKANPETGAVDDDAWIGKSIIKSAGRLSYDEVESVIKGSSNAPLSGVSVDTIRGLQRTASKFREARLGNRVSQIPPLRLLHSLDDENVPVENNIFDSSAVRELVEELSFKANFLVARKLLAALPDKAFLRRQQSPNPRRLHSFVDRMNRLGFGLDESSSGSLQSSLCKVQDDDLRKGMETIFVKSMQRAKYYVAGTVQDELRPHYTLNLPVYTHFTNPLRRYADVVVHRQLEAALSEGAIEFTDDIESLNKTADICNNKKDSAHNAQEQSVHIEACRSMDKLRQEIGGDLISEGIVLCVYESAFDVLIPEYGFEKRVHCDQLPLKKAEYRKDSRVLELYWEKGVPSSAYIPEDERPKPANSRAAQAAAAAREAEAARERAREREEALRRQTETGTMSADDVDALFDDDDDVSEVTEMAAGVSLNSADRSTQSMPPSPTRNGHLPQGPQRTLSDPKIATNTADAPEAKLTNKEKYLRLFKLREEGGEYIQDVTEMTRVPIILKTDLSKSPPCLTIRSVNPYAL